MGVTVMNAVYFSLKRNGVTSTLFKLAPYAKVDEEPIKDVNPPKTSIDLALSLIGLVCRAHHLGVIDKPS